MKVSQSQVNGWLKDPVTEAFMEAAKKITEDLIYKCGNGGCKSQNESIEELYAYYQGSIEASGLFSSPDGLLKTYDLVSKEAEDDK